MLIRYSGDLHAPAALHAKVLTSVAWSFQILELLRTQLRILLLHLQEFLRVEIPRNAILTMRKPSDPMLETVLAMYTSMPWIMDITAISVVVARMMPSRVRKLRSLLERSESAATAAASRNDAVWATC